MVHFFVVECNFRATWATFVNFEAANYNFPLSGTQISTCTLYSSVQYTHTFTLLAAQVSATKIRMSGRRRHCRN